jgi:hypothetical protein
MEMEHFGTKHFIVYSIQSQTGVLGGAVHGVWETYLGKPFSTGDQGNKYDQL